MKRNNYDEGNNRKNEPDSKGRSIASYCTLQITRKLKAVIYQKYKSPEVAHLHLTLPF